MSEHHSPEIHDGCQFCGAEVRWSGRPADVSYGSMVHADTNRVACADRPGVTV